jgi:hypothetical protein
MKAVDKLSHEGHSFRNFLGIQTNVEGTFRDLRFSLAQIGPVIAQAT